jgi:uncharacterized protein YggE
MRVLQQRLRPHPTHDMEVRAPMPKNRRIRQMVLITALMLSPWPALAQDAPPPGSLTPSIVTSGEAVLRRPADQAFVVAAVESRARNPRDAQQQNATGMSAVQQRLMTLGVARDAIRTLGYTIQQEFDFPDGRRVLKGFVARNAVEIRLDAVERVGEIVDAVVQSGASSIDRVRFEVRDRAAIEREALRLAVIDARARADAAAAGAGRTVDRILRIDDTRQAPPRPQMMMANAARAGDQQPSTPVEPGEIEIRAQVTLTVAIK